VPGAGRHGIDKRIEVDDHEVDQLQLPVGKLLQMARLVAAREDPGVHVGVQRLDAAIEHLGEPGQLVKGVDRNTRITQGALGASGRVDRHAKAVEPAREIVKSTLV